MSGDSSLAATASTASSSSASSDSKQQKPLCYHCAVRMSTLFRIPPPPPHSLVQQERGDFTSRCDDVAAVERTQPIVVRTFNANMMIVYETEASVSRLGVSTPWERLTSALGSDAPLNITTEVFSGDLSDGSCMNSDGDGASSIPTLTCVACLGLYQYMDDWIVPLSAASVRASPFLDSKTVSTNINCPRSMTFVWLAAAILFRQGAETASSFSQSGESGDISSQQPSPNDLIPEEFSSFKDFYQGDLRARILSFLTSAYHHNPQDNAPPVKEIGLATISRSAWVTHRRALDEIVKRRALPSNLASHSRDKAEEEKEPVAKKARYETELQLSHQRQPFRDNLIPRLCSQALAFAPNGDGIDVEVEVFPPESMDLLAVPDKIIDQWNKSRARACVNQGNYRKQNSIVSIVPSQYCSNKTGALMKWLVIYDNVLPYFKEHRIGCFAKSYQKEDEPLSEQLFSRVASVTVRVSHANLFLIGNYRKMVRSISQSPWFCEGGRVGTYSLQEIIAEPVLHAAFPYGVPSSVLPTSVAKRQLRTAEYRATLTAEENQLIDENRAAAVEQRVCKGRLVGGQASPWQSTDPFVTALDQVFGYGRYKFHSAGREDVDVRMLGTGRPFVLEIISPHRQYFSENDFRSLEALVNNSEGGAAEIEHLRQTSAEITLDLARHSESKTKTYRCVVWCSRSICSDSDPLLVQTNATRDLTLIQKTPLRVLHRRSLLDRPKIIHSIRCSRINHHWLVVDLETQAGTYVKEFIHGDNGRTTPNLGVLLGGRTDIIQLDVLGMVMPELT